jgi:hypothetical protein
MKALAIAALLLYATFAFGRDPKPTQSGTLVQMESVDCGMEQKGSKTLTGEILGTDAQHGKTHVLLCQEYTLQTEHVVYHIRPKDEKHPALLPVSTRAQFHLEKDKMKLSVEDLDGKEREYIVISMTPRETSPSAASR